jgi:hypothetical protein
LSPKYVAHWAPGPVGGADVVAADVVDDARPRVVDVTDDFFEPSEPDDEHAPSTHAQTQSTSDTPRRFTSTSYMSSGG